MEAAKIQQVQQQQMAHIARAQDALSMSAEDDIKKTQIRKPEHEENIKKADEDTERLKEWKKNTKRHLAGQRDNEQPEPLRDETTGHIIDIRV